MPTILRRVPARLAGAVLPLMLWAPAAARADYTTYRGDAAWSGVGTRGVGSPPVASAWTATDLGGAIWGQPLVHDGLVIVAAESDQAWALNESTGQVVWHAPAGARPGALSGHYLAFGCDSVLGPRLGHRPSSFRSPAYRQTSPEPSRPPGVRC